MDELRDIHGLDPGSWWPPAPGWWLLLLGTLLLLAGGIFLVNRWRFRERAWERDARRHLRRLRRELPRLDARSAAAELSTLLRRVAMARFGRSACAGLVGEDWLRWLTAHDPAGFDWSRHGRALVELSYAPPAAAPSGKEMPRLLKAADAWVRSPRRPAPSVAARAPEPVPLEASRV